MTRAMMVIGAGSQTETPSAGKELVEQALRLNANLAGAWTNSLIHVCYFGCCRLIS